MAKGSAPAKKLDDPYDKLEQAAKDIWDDIGSMGYKPEKGVGGLWFARKDGQLPKDAVGPAESLEPLRSMVKQEVAKADLQTPRAPKKQRLPGVEDPVVEELNEQADLVRDAKIKLDQAKTDHSNEAEILKGLLNKHKMKKISHGSWNHVLKDTQTLESKPETKKKDQKPAEE